MNLMDLFSVKPTPYEENAFYILQQIVEIKGKHPYMLLHVPKGLYTLIKQEGWRHEHLKRNNMVLLFPSLNEISERIDCETLFDYYSKIKNEKGDS